MWNNSSCTGWNTSDSRVLWGASAYLVCVLIFIANGIEQSWCASVFLVDFHSDRMDDNRNIWLGSGQEFWESHGILDALMERRLSAFGLVPKKEEEEGSFSRVCLCVSSAGPSGHPLGADPEQWQVYRTAPGQRADMWLKSNRDMDCVSMTADVTQPDRPDN